MCGYEAPEEAPCRRFGVSWRVALSILGTLLQYKGAGKSARVMGAMLKMRKLDIAVLRRAYEQG